jgi:hypothetical protein
MKNWSDYIDDNGLVVQKKSLGGDGGDSLNRTCVVGILDDLLPTQAIRPVNPYAVDRCADENQQKYCRNPHPPEKWYSKFDRTSRDQLIPLLILWGMIAHPNDLWNIFVDHLKRGLLFAYNTRRNFQYPTLEEQQMYSTPDVKWNYSWKMPDFTGPEFWALYIRGFECKWLYPLLLLFDLQTVIGAVIIRFNGADDVINHAVTLEFARVRMDTFWMKLARKITPRNILQVRLDSFFGKEIEPPINELFRALRD